jgi:hypothetical protein
MFQPRKGSGYGTVPLISENCSTDLSCCRVSRGTSTTEDKEYKSPYLMKVCGPNRELYKGPNDDLLL